MCPVLYTCIVQHADVCVDSLKFAVNVSPEFVRLNVLQNKDYSNLSNYE